jgi:hypothetical protein
MKPIPPVDKSKFDSLLKRMMDTAPEKTKTIKGTPGNLKPIVPSSSQR